MHRLATLASAAIAVVVLGACPSNNDEPEATTTTSEASTTTEAATGCGSVVGEVLDPNSGRHVLTDDESGVTWISDPPTSGPHRPVGDRTDFTEPVPKSVQVGILDRGDVLIQVRDEARRADVTPSNPAHVVVALNPTLPAPIVATAWQNKMLCETPDLEALRAFVEAFAGKGPSDH